ncbi:MAG: FAD-binding protein [Rhodobacteraceae bacterium]|nr:FAD-binding protein [Paracoccaceae bacterium]
MEMPDVNSAIIARKMAIIDRFIHAIGSNAVIHDHFETKAYECDGLTSYSCSPLAVVLPQTTEEVSAILAICHAEKLPVIPRGAGTSLAGGALPTEDSVVVGIARLNRILDIDYDNRFVRVQSGHTNLAITQLIEGDGFFYAPDPSSQLACTIAGNIAMNSGGAHCLKYGVTTNNLQGVKMVLMDGSIIDIGGEYFDSNGLDLLGVICGSEGQLGVVTEAILRIIPKPEGARPILFGFDSSVVAGNCVSDIIASGILPVAIEFMDKLCIQACENFSNAGYPSVDALLIVEVEGSEEEIEWNLQQIKQIALHHNPVAIRESKSELESQKIWLGRKSAFGAMGKLGDYICLDGTIPVTQLPEVLGGISRLSEKYGLAVANVFHAGDGNLHPLIIFDANADGQLAKAELLGAEILKLCVKLDGCLSGEHGVGVEKRDLMLDQFTHDDLEIQMRIKDVFDPHWLLNPAKVFPLDQSKERRAN